ncbi:MAG: recombinase family protein [Firmicutes bacterium]|nr:recombinase family protein [Bacillota bacterium]
MDLYTVRNNIMKGVLLQELNLRVCFYARVSTDKDEQLHSLKSQISFFNDYISKVPNWQYIGSYIDEGISGTSVNKREEFLKMIEDAKRHKFDLILTKEISRFSRSTLDSIKYTQELLSNGVGVYFLNDNINTILPDSELRLTMMSSIAQDEVRRLSERVSFGMKRSIDNGVVLGCSNIYGYVKDKGKLVIDETQAEMIKIIFDRYANTTDSLSKVSRYLETHGYKSKTGKRLDTTILTRIIENPKYKGYYCGHKTKVLDYRTKKKKKLNESDWIIYKDNKNVPPIVSEELWNRANKKLKMRQESFTNRVNNKKVFQNRYTYSGKIYCGCHFVTYHRSSAGKRKNNPAWECQIYRKESLKGCSNPRVFELELDKIFKNLFNKLFKRKNHIFDEIINECKNYLEINNNDTEIKNLDSKIRVLNNKKDKLLELLMEQYLSKIDYKKQINIINEEINNYQNKINELQNNKKDKNYIENKISIIKEALNNSLNDNECFSDVFNELIDRVFVYKENNKKIKLDIYLKTGENLYTTSDNSGKKFHFLDYVTTSKSG